MMVHLDSQFSSDPVELKSLIKSCNNTKKALGDIKYGPTTQEKNSIKKGEVCFL